MQGNKKEHSVPAAIIPRGAESAQVAAREGVGEERYCTEHLTLPEIVFAFDLED